MSQTKRSSKMAAGSADSSTPSEGVENVEEAFTQAACPLVMPSHTDNMCSDRGEGVSVTDPNIKSCAAPPLNPLFAKVPFPPRQLSHRSQRSPQPESTTPSVTSSKTGWDRVPPALPVHRATTPRDSAASNSPDNEGGIVESSRSHLTRLSLEDAVVALERLRYLMMSHTAAVTGSRTDGADVLPPPEVHVDPFKLSKRPLEDIAEELCSQLRRLTTAYAVASNADLCLMGVKNARRVAQPLAEPGLRDESPSRLSEAGPEEVLVGEVFGTFGPMVSTQTGTTIHSLSDGAAWANGNFLDSRFAMDIDGEGWGAIDVQKPNPGPRIAYPQRSDNDSDNTVFQYPNGTVVSFPASTFGELVSTESGHGTVRCRGVTPISGTERRVVVSDGTQTDAVLFSTKEKELQAYVKALEARLTEKQRLEAMRESRGGSKRHSISENLARLARTTEAQKLAKTADAAKN